MAVYLRLPKHLAGLLKVTKFVINNASAVTDGVIDSRLLTSSSAGPVRSYALLPARDLMDQSSGTSLRCTGFFGLE